MTKSLIALAKPIVGRFPQIAHKYRTWRDNRYENKWPAMTPFGFMLTGHADMMDGSFEPVETDVIQCLLANTDVFINVGANVGYYVLHALKAGVYTVAMEPLRSNANYLMRNICANNWESLVEVLPIAISDRPGVVELFGAGTGASLIPGWAGAPTTGGQLTPANTIDNILGVRFAGRRCLVLMDVEGFEDMALAGAGCFLTQDPKPTWVVEICIHEHLGILNPHLVSTFSRFWRTGYEAWTCTETPRKVSAEEVNAVAETNLNTLGTHNFIFCAPGSIASVDK